MTQVSRRCNVGEVLLERHEQPAAAHELAAASSNVRRLACLLRRSTAAQRRVRVQQEASRPVSIMPVAARHRPHELEVDDTYLCLTDEQQLHAMHREAAVLVGRAAAHCPSRPIPAKQSLTARKWLQVAVEEPQTDVRRARKRGRRAHLVAVVVIRHFHACEVGGPQRGSVRVRKEYQRWVERMQNIVLPWAGSRTAGAQSKMRDEVEAQALRRPRVSRKDHGRHGRRRHGRGHVCFIHNSSITQDLTRVR